MLKVIIPLKNCDTSVIKYTSSFDIQLTFIKLQKSLNGTKKNITKKYIIACDEVFKNSFIFEIVHRKVDENE